VRLGLRFRREKVRFKNKSQKMNRLEIAFLKNCDLKTQKKCLFKSQAIECFFENAVF
jgi:hypothetical protein